MEVDSGIRERLKKKARDSLELAIYVEQMSGDTERAAKLREEANDIRALLEDNDRLREVVAQALSCETEANEAWEKQKQAEAERDAAILENVRLKERLLWEDEEFEAELKEMMAKYAELFRRLAK